MTGGKRRRTVLAALALAGILGIANIQVTTTQGVNFELSTHRIPLYVKSFEFLDRNTHYRQLASEIAGRGTEAERVIAAFEWTRRNIRPTPDGWPIVDDHILHIIIRGHGTSDQRADVFAMLATYAGVPAFWRKVKGPAGGDGVILSFAWIDGRWIVMDVGNGFLFRNGRGELASAEELAADPALLPPPARALMIRSTPYPLMFTQLRTPPIPRPLRAELQMPWPRLWDQSKRAVGRQ